MPETKTVFRNSYYPDTVTISDFSHDLTEPGWQAKVYVYQGSRLVAQLDGTIVSSNQVTFRVDAREGGAFWQTGTYTLRLVLEKYDGSSLVYRYIVQIDQQIQVVS